ncbi:MAG: hypothetical protein ABR549_12165 [Mycobacteriales bacterium]
MARGGQGSDCNPAEAKTRLQDAREFLELASLKADDNSRAAQKAAAANAVLAGIAAADAICCVRLGRRSSSSNHDDAVRLLAEVDGALARHLAVLIEIKTPSQYGTSLLNKDKVIRAMRAASELVSAAERIVGSR